ncbi:23S rRNA (adenine(2503)-C(2))-methyltransferase [bacterium Unc6]|nr:23S rRNA (adenine(2503)-C(2))-methyltransferase [bacterium Unc6]
MTQQIKYITDFLPEEFQNKISQRGFDKYRAEQVLNWIYKKRIFDFNLMTNISVDLRKVLTDGFKIFSLKVVADVSSNDGTCKRLLEMQDGGFTESVWLPRRNYGAVCISTQSGCPVRCKFCASGQMGFIRNLTTSEIVGQFLITPPEGFFASHIVFMGMGEPLLNYENVIKSIKIFNHPEAGKIGARRITISTAGVIEGIEKLADEDMQIELAISLHSADNNLRTELVPLNKKYPLKKLILTCREYIKKTNRQITFEYVSLKNVNDRIKDAILLSKIISGILCKVNLIEYNKTEGLGFKKSSKKSMHEFTKILKKHKIPVTVRASQGAQVQAGCGQLMGRCIEDAKKKLFNSL